MQDMHAKIDQLKYEVEIHHLLYGGELAHLRTITFQCLCRSQQIMANTVTYIPLPAESHNDLAQLFNELGRTTLHPQIPHAVYDDSPPRQPEP